MDIIIIVMSIIGTVLGIIILNNFKLIRRIMIIFSIDLFLYFFHFPLVYLSISLASLLFPKANTDLYFWIAIGMYLSFSILTPMFSYSVYKYKKEKKILKCIISSLISIIVFVIILTLMIGVCNK